MGKLADKVDIAGKRLWANMAADKFSQEKRLALLMNADATIDAFAHAFVSTEQLGITGLAASGLIGIIWTFDLDCLIMFAVCSNGDQCGIWRALLFTDWHHTTDVYGPFMGQGRLLKSHESRLIKLTVSKEFWTTALSVLAVIDTRLSKA